MENKKLWDIYHIYGTDGGFGDYVTETDHVGTVEATEEEIQRFLDQWNKPEVYSVPYASLDCHTVIAEPVEVVDITTFEPYSTSPDDYFNRGIREIKERKERIRNGD